MSEPADNPSADQSISGDDGLRPAGSQVEAGAAGQPAREQGPATAGENRVDEALGGADW